MIEKKNIFCFAGLNQLI